MTASDLLAKYRQRTGELDSGALDNFARATPDVDAFCSSSRWAVASLHTLRRAEFIYELGTEESRATFVRHVTGRGHVTLLPFDCDWCLNAPVLGADPNLSYSALIRRLQSARRSWDYCYVGGFLRDSGSQAALFRFALESDLRLFSLPNVVRDVLDLSEGYDAWLARRARSFRRNLRRAARIATETRVEFSRHTPAVDEADDYFARFVSIEQSGWKGDQDTGICTEPMASFSRSVFRRCVARGEARVVLAHVDGEPVGYLYGACTGANFRGLHMAYAERVRRASVGNLLQNEMIRWARDEDVTQYDFGSAMDYKRRWCDDRIVLASFLLQ